ncbi:PREDICTED: lymphocyte cytosolic protein 2-like isoform X2 [Vollenhovia emeryi]|uniref:lymphocyte cytosolic protein 2-like isoform X2 n=1 Tax=Vollenhovia emeryi TaxID=411798 RepID=UPI0005F5804C|nr:PREDICTED: lymphocyte cytosolic protein 2-like isoform X2 [Vollenhovia emeryi]
MSKKPSRSDALDDISAWSTDGVLCLLRKNGLEECCKAVAKRQIDGDELLHLTDGKLALWKSDLTRPLIGKLWAFVQELNKSPEKYLPDRSGEAQQNDDHLSDSGSWGTDFEDEAAEENNSTDEIIKPSQIKNKQMSLQNNRMISRIPTRPPSKKVIKPEEEETYANCNSAPGEEENMYANFQETKPPPTRNVSRLHGKAELEKTLAGKLKLELEELKRRNDPTKKPEIRPKPESLPLRRIPMTAADKKSPQRSFLHNAPKTDERGSNEQGKTQRRMNVPPPPEPKKSKDYTSVEIKKDTDKESSKPPVILRNFDLVANLPAQTQESEDEYEPLNESIVEQVQQKNEISRVDSKQSLHSGRQGSVESVYKPPSVASHEEEEDYEIYESITETPEDNEYLSPIQRTSDAQEPPPLPAKPSPPPPPSTFPGRTRSEKHKERSPDKKSATLPHAGSNTSLSTERATRPLPPPPERQSYVDKPWYHNITREQAMILIRERTYSNQQDGYFLLRPSTTNPGNPLALVLWYRDRVYNVPVRRRNDNRYALGSAKVNELSFSSVEEIVAFYMTEELMLYSGGAPTGSTKLTDTPPK